MISECTHSSTHPIASTKPRVLCRCRLAIAVLTASCYGEPGDLPARVEQSAQTPGVFDQFPESSYPNGWLIASQGNSPNNWSADGMGRSGTLDLWTRDPSGGGACTSDTQCRASQCVAGACRQRVKQRSPRSDFGYGTYSWRVFLAMPTPAGAQFSTGAFVYADDAHELDFECGYGTAAARAGAMRAPLVHLDGSRGSASATEILCYMTSQGSPARSVVIAVQSGAWYTLELSLMQGVGETYSATWRINGTTVSSLQLTYGPNSPCAMYDPTRRCTFGAYISVENLAFIGDVYPTSRNDTLFDWFSYAP